MSNKSKLYWDLRRVFFEKYHTDCMPFLAKLEIKRKKILLACSVFMLLSWVIGVGSFWYFGFQDLELLFAFPILALGIFVVYFIEYSNRLKRSVIPILCEAFGNFKWDPEKKIDTSFYKDSCVFDRYYNRESIDDVFCGEFNNVKIDIIEMNCQYYEKTEKKTQVSTIFDGVVLCMDMNKKFTSHTVLTKDSFLSSSPSASLKRTELEDVTFEKLYNVYTNDEVEARYLLTTTFMEKMSNLKSDYGYKNVSVSLYKGKFIIAISNTKNFFEVGSLFTKSNNDKKYIEFFEELISLISLIEYFNLDKKLGV